jgi:hypothetical protein
MQKDPSGLVPLGESGWLAIERYSWRTFASDEASSSGSDNQFDQVILACQPFVPVGQADMGRISL